MRATHGTPVRRLWFGERKFVFARYLFVTRIAYKCLSGLVF
jgi:hypothetical protein